MSAGSRSGHIFVMPLAGGAPRQLTTRPQNIAELAWSPDGRALAYTVDVAGEIQLWRLDLDSGEASRFAIDNLSIGLTWAPRDTWTIREVTLEIPVDAALLALGVELTGKGKAHADTLTLDILPPP